MPLVSIRGLTRPLFYLTTIFAAAPGWKKFTDCVEQTSVLGYLVEEGCTIGSWSHFADLLYIRDHVGLTEVDAVHKVANKIRGKHHLFFDLGKTA